MSTFFEKVTYKNFETSMLDVDNNFDIHKIKEIYDNIKIPKRATKLSAGYDFCSTLEFTLKPKEEIKIPTGIRAKMKDNEVLLIFPRSSLGFKYRFQLNNSIGVIDADYYYSDNEGHIFIKMFNGGSKDIEIKLGNAFAQGIFLNYNLTDNDDASNIRNGGIGSTNA